ncbi:hypothetical protein TNCV_2143691 [Trichonephila clavipes]|nr:hypothetical protein TNCV_2143691 [Trichonephila clavipes]
MVLRQRNLVRRNSYKLTTMQKVPEKSRNKDKVTAVLLQRSASFPGNTERPVTSTKIMCPSSCAQKPFQRILPNLSADLHIIVYIPKLHLCNCIALHSNCSNMVSCMIRRCVIHPGSNSATYL